MVGGVSGHHLDAIEDLGASPAVDKAGLHAPPDQLPGDGKAKLP
jgi:hypothetical protein